MMVEEGKDGTNIRCWFDKTAIVAIITNIINIVSSHTYLIPIITNCDDGVDDSGDGIGHNGDGVNGGDMG